MSSFLLHLCWWCIRHASLTRSHEPNDVTTKRDDFFVFSFCNRDKKKCRESCYQALTAEGGKDILIILSFFCSCSDFFFLPDVASSCKIRSCDWGDIRGLCVRRQYTKATQGNANWRFYAIMYLSQDFDAARKTITTVKFYVSILNEAKGYR